MLVLAGTAVGQTWTVTGPFDTYWGAVACSADGSKVMAVPNSSCGIYLSTNAGGEWDNRPIATFALERTHRFLRAKISSGKPAFPLASSHSALPLAT